MSQEKRKDCWFFKIPGETERHRIRNTGGGKHWPWVRAGITHFQQEERKERSQWPYPVELPSSKAWHGDFVLLIYFGSLLKKNMEGSMGSRGLKGEKLSNGVVSEIQPQPNPSKSSDWVCLPLRQRGWTFITLHHYPSAAALSLWVRRLP